MLPGFLSGNAYQLRQGRLRNDVVPVPTSSYSLAPTSQKILVTDLAFRWREYDTSAVVPRSYVVAYPLSAMAAPRRLYRSVAALEAEEAMD